MIVIDVVNPCMNHNDDRNEHEQCTLTGSARLGKRVCHAPMHALYTAGAYTYNACGDQ